MSTNPKTLAAEYRPSMTLEVLHAWAKDAQALLEQIGGADADPEKVFLKVYGSEMLGSTARVFAARYANALRAQFLAALAQATPSDTERGLYEALKGVVRVADRKTDEFDAARAAIAAYEAKRGGVA